jgi:hypothetical protein
MTEKKEREKKLERDRKKPIKYMQTFLLFNRPRVAYKTSSAQYRLFKMIATARALSSHIWC